MTNQTKQAKKRAHYRSAVIRVSRVNQTQQGEIIYEFDEIKQTLREWSVEKTMKFYAIEHNEDPTNIHYHIVVDFAAYATFETIKNKFPYGSIERARNKKASIQYLIHLNDPSKKQYVWSDIYTNDDDIEKYQGLSREILDMRVRQLTARIKSGELKRYNFYDVVEDEVYIKRKQQLETALDLYIKRLLVDQDRHIKVIVLEGDTATGKTVFARNYAKEQGVSSILSSGNNDPFQDYAGQEVLILDDLRDDVFSLSNLLKILDPHHNVTNISRYTNKLFIGDVIFITTNQPWTSWYPDLPTKDRNALFRRPDYWFQFEKIPNAYRRSLVTVSEWDDDKAIYQKKYEFEFDYSSMIPDEEENEMDDAIKFIAQYDVSSKLKK